MAGRIKNGMFLAKSFVGIAVRDQLPKDGSVLITCRYFPIRQSPGRHRLNTESTINLVACIHNVLETSATVREIDGFVIQIEFEQKMKQRNC